MKKKTKIPKYAQGSTVGSIVGAGVGALGFIGGPALGMATMGLGSQLGARVGAEFDDDNIVPQPSMPVLPMINAHTGNNVNMYPFGGMMNMPNAEVEKQEVARTPDGQTIMFDGPSHAQGGIKTNLPNGTEITSDRLINPLTGNTFAKDQKQIELKKAKLNNKLKDRPNDKYLSSSIKILDNESQKIFDLQEMMKPMEPPQQMFANGGTIKYDDGGTFKFPYTNQWNNNKSDYDFYSNYKPLSKGYENFSPFIKFGGYNNPYQYDYMNDPNIPNGATAEEAKQFDIDRGVLSTPSTNTKTDYGMMGLGLAGVNLASQFANSFMPEKIQDTRNRFYAPALRTYGDAVQKQRNLRYNIGDQITGINNSERDANRYISNNISSGNVRAGNMLANRAASMLGRNQLYGDRNRIEYGYQADANKMQMGYGEFLNNVGQQQSLYDTNLRDMRLQQRANLRGIRAQALGNTSTMLQQYGRDQKMMQLLPYMFPNANPNMFN